MCDDVNKILEKQKYKKHKSVGCADQHSPWINIVDKNQYFGIAFAGKFVQVLQWCSVPPSEPSQA